MKRIFAWLLSLTLLLTCLSLPAAHADQATAIVKGGWLRLRDTPSSSGDTISAYFTGTTVTILGGSGSWYRVKTPDGKTGYMHSDFLTITSSITGGQIEANTAAKVTSSNGKAVRLRSGPSKEYDTLGSYQVGTPLTVLTNGTTWCKVRINGQVGYMMTEFITTSGALPSNYTAYVVASNGKNCVLRDEASTSGDILASWPVGTKVTVLKYGSTWSQVRGNGVTGYMMSQYLSTTKPDNGQEEADGYTAYVVSENGLGVRMRSGAGMLYPTVATYNVGTKVTVIKKGSTWSQVRVGETTGYMMTQFLSTKAPATSVTIQDVFISNMSPKVGQTLTAYVTPSTALAAYRWYRSDGTMVGRGNSYTVTADDLGYRLMVSALGNGDTLGTADSDYTKAVTASSTQVTLTSVALSDMTPAVGQTLTAYVTPAAATATIYWWRSDGALVGTGNAYTVGADDAGYRLNVTAYGTGSTDGTAESGNTAKVTADGGGSDTGIALTAVTLSDTTPTVGQTLYATAQPYGATASYTWYSDGVKVGYASSYTVTEADEGRHIKVQATGMGSFTGSAMAECTALVEAANKTIILQSVTIEDNTPNVGQTLNVVLKPANATADLTWRCSDGRILGYGETYRVTEEENGKSIYVYANGTGDTRGSAVSGLTSLVTSAATAKLRIDGVTLSDLTPVVGQTLVATLDPGAATATLTWYRDDDVILAYGAVYTVRQVDLGHSIYVWAEGTGETFGSANSKITAPVAE